MNAGFQPVEWLYVGVAFAVSLAACALLVRLGKSGFMLDRPNPRSLHLRPTPRTGGIAIAFGLLPVAMHILFDAEWPLLPLIAGWALVFVVSLFDDARDLPAVIRLSAHLAAALLVVLGSTHSLEPFPLLLGIFWMVWGTNLFNFMDGMDGLAGSMAVLGGAVLAVALLVNGALAPALLLAAVAAAAAGFLVFNRPPARIFMGDAGSASLGFVFAAVSVETVAANVLPAWLPVLVFLPFIADATLTLFVRAWQRKVLWQAHRDHAYQALVLSGWPVQRALLVFIAAMLLCGLISLVSLETASAGISGWISVMVATVVAGWAYYGIMAHYKPREFRYKGNSGDGA